MSQRQKIKRRKHGPEWYIRRDIIELLKARGWLVEITHGNQYQSGLPDLYVAHPRYGKRWIDAKNPGEYTFTRAQKQKWPVWDEFGIGIWILIAGTQEEYDKLFQAPNWRQYWKPSWGEIPDIDELLDSLIQELDATSDEAQ